MQRALTLHQYCRAAEPLAVRLNLQRRTMNPKNGGRVARILGEFTIIVLGVLVALAAESWRQDREDARSARSAISLLVEDLRTDSTRLAGVLRPGPRRDTASARLLYNASNPTFSSDSAAFLLVDLLAGSDVYAPRRATFESLLQNDGVRHIGTPDLQARLVRYYQETQADVAAWLELWKQQYQAYTDQLAKHASPTPATMEEALGVWRRTTVTVETPWPELAADRELMSRIWLVRGYERNTHNRVRAALEANAALIGSLTGES